MITGVPGELLHIPETNDEQEDIAGEPFFDICGKKLLLQSPIYGETWVRILDR